MIGQMYCEAMFDGWGCWVDTPAGTTATLSCYNTIFRMTVPPDTSAVATRVCESNGTWFVHPSSNDPYSNYSACTHVAELPTPRVHEVVPVYLFIGGSCLSVVLLVISLVIFQAFRQLRCERITVHKNLFLSYVLSNILWILHFILVNADGDVLVQNPVWCQVLHVVGQYFNTCNFTWMFCEGLYIQFIMAHALRSGRILMRVLLFIGWGCPVILTTIYAAVRGAMKSATHTCWRHANVYQWILGGPILASIVANTLILINLVRLLLTKLRQVPDAPQSRKAVRATLILVPLFGLHYLLFPVQPPEDTVLYDFYHYAIALLTSLQGALVAIMYCFCNDEVKAIVRRKWTQYRLMTGRVRNNAASLSYTDGYSVINTSLAECTGQNLKVTPDTHNCTSATSQDPVEMKPLKIERSGT